MTAKPSGNNRVAPIRRASYIGTVFPTHRCFDDSIEFCERRARTEHPNVETLRLVHAIILVPVDQPATGDLHPGDRAVHAWVEDGDLVWDAGLLPDGRRIEFAVAKAEYYAHYRVQETTVYTMRELLEHNRASGHYGPWRPEYQALCRPRNTYICPRCGRTSHHREDAANKYCGACHKFEEP